MLKKDKRQWYMIGVLTLLYLSVQCGLWRIILVGKLFKLFTAEGLVKDAIKHNILVNSTAAIAVLYFLLFTLAMWFFCFKYWQTAFELKNLFVRIQVAEKQKQKVTYFLINAVVLSTIFLTYFYVYFTTIRRKYV